MESFKSFSANFNIEGNLTDTVYWISPQGKFINAEHRHISSILSNPELFGETEDSIKDTYVKFDEQPSPTVEGQAREEIMIRVLKRGFIRIRDVRHKWTVQVDKVDENTKEVIWKWARSLMKLERKRTYDDVIVLQLHNNRKSQYNVEEIASHRGIVK